MLCFVKDNLSDQRADSRGCVAIKQDMVLTKCNSTKFQSLPTRDANCEPSHGGILQLIYVGEHISGWVARGEQATPFSERE